MIAGTAQYLWEEEESGHSNDILHYTLLPQSKIIAKQHQPLLIHCPVYTRDPYQRLELDPSCGQDEANALLERDVPYDEDQGLDMMSYSYVDHGTRKKRVGRDVDSLNKEDIESYGGQYRPRDSSELLFDDSQLPENITIDWIKLDGEVVNDSRRIAFPNGTLIFTEVQDSL